MSGRDCQLSPCSNLHVARKIVSILNWLKELLMQQKVILPDHLSFSFVFVS